MLRCPQCGLGNFDGSVRCRLCQTPLASQASTAPGPASGAPLPPRSDIPKVVADEVDVMESEVAFPVVCAKCGATTRIGWSTVTFGEGGPLRALLGIVVLPPLLVAIILVGLMGMAAWMSRDPLAVETPTLIALGLMVLVVVVTPVWLLAGQPLVKIRVPLCSGCSVRWWLMRTGRDSLFVATLFLSTASLIQGRLMVAASLLLLGLLVAWGFTHLLLRPAGIAANAILGERVRLTGFGPDFRNALKTQDPESLVRPGKPAGFARLGTLAVAALAALFTGLVLPSYGFYRYGRYVMAHKAEVQARLEAQAAEARALPSAVVQDGSPPGDSNSGASWLDKQARARQERDARNSLARDKALKAHQREMCLAECDRPVDPQKREACRERCRGMYN